MDNIKETQRAELHKTIWKMANELRGTVDGWDFKSYVLTMLFYRYISEKIVRVINDIEIKAGEAEFDYAKLDDEEALTQKEYITNLVGYFIKPSQLFMNVRANAKDDENLNITVTEAFEAIEESSKKNNSNNNFEGLFDDVDFNNVKRFGNTVLARNTKLRNLLDAIGDANLGNFEDNTIDAFGDAYEYLMGMYASNAGKSGGEYYTPQEVSELLTLISVDGKEKVRNVYDPACGSGSLLLNTVKILGKDSIVDGLYGQELNPTTHSLCKINMFLHGLDFNKFDIAHGDTLVNPLNAEKGKFEVIVSNPPYSTKWEGKDNVILANDERFVVAGDLAPKSKADMAFIMHCLYSLAHDGVASIVCFPGIFYRGGAEKTIRKYLVDNNFIDAIIQLPEDLFYGTSIATCILVLKKNKTDDKVLFVNASKEFVKVTNNNKLTKDNIKNILNCLSERKDIEYLTKLVSIDEIGKENDYNLSVSTYVEVEDTKEVIDIIELEEEIENIVLRINNLRNSINQIVKGELHD